MAKCNWLPAFKPEYKFNLTEPNICEATHMAKGKFKLVKYLCGKKRRNLLFFNSPV